MGKMKRMLEEDFREMKCVKCGCEGVHACIGKKIERAIEEQEEYDRLLNLALEKVLELKED